MGEVLKMGKFETGQVVVTAGVAAEMEHNPGFIKFVLSHSSGMRSATGETYVQMMQK